MLGSTSLAEEKTAVVSVYLPLIASGMDPNSMPDRGHHALHHLDSVEEVEDLCGYCCCGPPTRIDSLWVGIWSPIWPHLLG